MNKSELVEALTDRLGSRKDAVDALDAVVDEVIRAVSKGEKVSITGFGVFEKRDRKARTARNPRTGESVKVKKTSVPAFRAGQGFKDVVSGAKKLAKAAKPAKAAKATVAKKSAKVAKPAAKKAAKKTVKTAKAAKPAAKPAKKSVKKTAKKATKRGSK